MSRVVTATEAKAKLSELMRWAVMSGNEVIVENHGTPQVVLLPYSEYEELKTLKEHARRQAALERLRQLAREVQAQNEGITLAEADRVADEMTREAIDNLVQQGKIRFEE